eukprot:5806017-Pyramimonas_sp.AAC.1
MCSVHINNYRPGSPIGKTGHLLRYTEHTAPARQRAMHHMCMRVRSTTISYSTTRSGVLSAPLPLLAQERTRKMR